MNVNLVTYQHQKTRRAKNLTIKIKSAEEVVIVTPPWVSAKQAQQFIQKKQAWIQAQLAKLNQRPKVESSEKIMIFGKHYQKKIIAQNRQLPGVQVKETRIIINTLDKKSSPQRYLDRFLKQTATKYLIPRTHQLATLMSTKFNRITLRQQKTRWGSCSNKKNLNFNWRLVHHPPEVIDYVIIHELAHCKELNHSTKFWQIVKQLDPEYRLHQGWLKRYGMIIG